MALDYDVHNLKGILATFDEDQEIENPAEDNEQPRQKKRKTGNAPDDKWFGEFYKVGGNPSCRTCGKKITNENRLVIRTDVATTFQKPNSKSREFLLRSETVRFCVNTFCHKNLPVKNYRHIMKLASLNLGYLPAKYHEEFTNVLKNTVIGFEFE